jgi:Dolichyl-phosphate-mannose-protein mannosyltransferase
MKQDANNFSPALIRLTWLLIGGFIALNIAFALFRLTNKNFNADELQHLHIAWLIAQGKIVYRDFWEHHGPLYSLLNGALIHLVNAEPTVRILLWLRLLSFSLMCGIAVLVWFMARQLGLSRMTAWLAVAAYSSLDMIQNKGVEMRPDVPQAFFWIAGLLVLLRNQSEDGSMRRAAYAGALFALAILCNAKAGIGPFFAVLFYPLAYWVCSMKWRDIGRDLLGMTIGGLIAASPILLYFVANDGALDFLYFNFVWNVLFSMNWSADLQAASTGSGMRLSVEYFWFYIQKQLPFTILVIAGLTFWLRKLRNESDQASKQRNWLFLIATLGTSLGWLTDRHSQFFLIFLPLLSILAAYALVQIGALWPHPYRRAGVIFSATLSLLAAGGMIAQAATSTPFRQTDLLRQQKEFTQRLVGITDRNEPLGVVWSLCGGYMFNEITGFYWVAIPFHSEIIEKLSGEHPFRESFIKDIENKNVRYVIGVDKWMTEGLSQEALEYLEKNFDYSYCLWTRKLP